MAINVQCPTCGSVLPVPAELAGQAVRCGGCNGAVRVPDVGGPSVPVARPVRPVPVAAPAVSRRPPPTRRRVRDADDERPRRTGGGLPTMAKVWLALLAASAVGGLGCLAAAAVGPRTPAAVAPLP